MRVKHYFNRYKATENKPLIIALTFADIALEANEKVKELNSGTYQAIKEIYDASNEKAIEFIKLVNEINSFKVELYSYKTYIKNSFPELYNILKWTNQ